MPNLIPHRPRRQIYQISNYFDLPAALRSRAAEEALQFNCIAVIQDRVDFRLCGRTEHDHELRWSFDGVRASYPAVAVDARDRETVKLVMYGTQVHALPDATVEIPRSQLEKLLADHRSTLIEQEKLAFLHRGIAHPEWLAELNAMDEPARARFLAEVGGANDADQEARRIEAIYRSIKP